MKKTEKNKSHMIAIDGYTVKQSNTNPTAGYTIKSSGNSPTNPPNVVSPPKKP